MRVGEVGITESTEMIFSFRRGHRENFEALTLRVHRGSQANGENLFVANPFKRTIKFIQVPSQLKSYFHCISEHVARLFFFHRGHREFFEVLALRVQRGSQANGENHFVANPFKRTIKFIQVPSQLKSYFHCFSEHATRLFFFHRGHLEDFEVLTLRGHAACIVAASLYERTVQAIDQKIKNGC